MIIEPEEIETVKTLEAPVSRIREKTDLDSFLKTLFYISQTNAEKTVNNLIEVLKDKNHYFEKEVSELESIADDITISTDKRLITISYKNGEKRQIRVNIERIIKSIFKLSPGETGFYIAWSLIENSEELLANSAVLASFSAK